MSTENKPLYPEPNSYPYPSLPPQPNPSQPPSPPTNQGYQAGYQGGYQAPGQQGNGYAPLYAPQPGYGPPTSYPPGAYPQQYTTTTTVYRDGGSSAGMGIGWILFIIGWFFPICWLFGAFFACSGDVRERSAGKANLTMLLIMTILVIIFLVLGN